MANFFELPYTSVTVVIVPIPCFALHLDATTKSTLGLWAVFIGEKWFNEILFCFFFAADQ